MSIRELGGAVQITLMFVNINSISRKNINVGGPDMLAKFLKSILQIATYSII